MDSEGTHEAGRARFIDEEIEVAFAKKPGPPTSFVWRDVEYAIVESRLTRRVLDFKAA